ncbi:MAG: hypothetical protein HY234_16320 [Acidobacteria bacterium]|nr:hypothetical protein [Acidobacteriota bacterium]
MRARLFALVLLTMLSASHTPAQECSVYFYGAEKTTPAEWRALLAKWRAAGITRAIVSLESGPALLLADPAQAQVLASRFAESHAAGVQVEGLMLQDPSWTSRLPEARQRVRAVADFLRQHPGLVDRLQIDVEPYAARERVVPRKAWRALASLLTDMREELLRAQPGTRLSAALPWWVARAMTPHEFSAVSGELDDIVLMAYGDPGGQPVAADSQTFKRKVLPALELLGHLHATVRIGVAKYEHASSEAMARHAAQLDKLLKRLATFSGIVYFHESAPFLRASTAEVAPELTAPAP